MTVNLLHSDSISDSCRRFNYCCHDSGHSKCDLIEVMVRFLVSEFLQQNRHLRGLIVDYRRHNKRGAAVGIVT